jgi:hypothetical protein
VQHLQSLRCDFESRFAEVLRFHGPPVLAMGYDSRLIMDQTSVALHT